MDILPATIVADVTDAISDVFTNNAELFAISVLVGTVAFALRWFRRVARLKV